MSATAVPTTSTPPAVAVGEGRTMAGRVRQRLSSRAATAAAIVIAVLWTIPTFGLLVSSFRPEDDIKANGWWNVFTDPAFTLQNYNEVLFGGGSSRLSTARLSEYFLNSIVITIPSVLFPLLIGSLAAYALSWMNWRGRDWVFLGIFALQIVPLQMALVPLLRLFSQGLTLGGVTIVPDLNLVGVEKFATVWFAHTCFALPLCVFLLHNFMSDLPRELIEAARVDGADHARIFRSITLPLIVPALASFAIFQFLWVWNDLLIALIFAGGTQDVAPLTVKLADLAGTRGNEWQRLTAGAFVSMAVPIVVFLSLQRYFVRGLLVGGLKG
jgi:alpha-glucoside transport system permease protein